MQTDHTTMKRIALVVLTRAGLALALRLQEGLATDVHIYASPRAFPVDDAFKDRYLGEDMLSSGGTCPYGQCRLNKGIGGRSGSAQGTTPTRSVPSVGVVQSYDPGGNHIPTGQIRCLNGIGPCSCSHCQFTLKPVGACPCGCPCSPSTPKSSEWGEQGSLLHHAHQRGQAEGAAPTGDHQIPTPERGLPLPSITRFDTIAPLLSQLWATYDQIVLFFALGAVVRLIAPLLRHKHTDPGIVAIDDAGRFAISVVSGHIGDANGLALRCAEVLGATPVVTTASDVHNTLAVDLLAHTQGWQVEDPSAMTAVSAAIVNGEAVAILQDCVNLDWWKNENPWPANLLHVTNPQEVSATRFAALLVIADRLIEGLPQDVPTLVYRPPTLVLAVGCRRGVSFDTLDTFIKRTLAQHRLAFQSVACLTTADIKANEVALQMLVQRYDWGFETHAVAVLKTMTEVPNPSERVQRLVGTPSVCEAAALLSSNGGTLIVAKHKGEGMTIAVARKANR